MLIVAGFVLPSSVEEPGGRGPPDYFPDRARWARNTARNIWSASQNTAVRHEAPTAPHSQMLNGSLEGT